MADLNIITKLTDTSNVTRDIGGYTYRFYVRPNGSSWDITLQRMNKHTTTQDNWVTVTPDEIKTAMLNGNNRFVLDIDYYYAVNSSDNYHFQYELTMVGSDRNFQPYFLKPNIFYFEKIEIFKQSSVNYISYHTISISLINGTSSCVVKTVVNTYTPIT